MTFTTATVPNPDIPLVNPQTGCINPDWWLWIVAIFNRTGGAGSPVDINSLQLDSAYPFAQMVASRYPLPQQQQTPFETSLSLAPGAKTEIAQLKNRIHNLETLFQAAQRKASSISYTTIDGTPIGQAVPSTGSFSSLTTGSLNVTTPLPVASGGTGSNTSAGARSNLGLGSMATQNSNAVAITGGAIDGTPIGAVTASTGKFTALQATGAISPSTTNGVIGTTLGDNVVAGSIGEYVSSTASGVSLINGTVANITSISLSAGDWDVQGNVLFTPAGTTTTSLTISAVSITSAALPAQPLYSQNDVSVPAGLNSSLGAPIQRINVTTTTTAYLVAQANFAVSTMTAGGIIRARRVR